jgi:predicted O-methyltransferase YrrM
METVDLSDNARAYVRSRYARPDWAKGTVSREDAAFLFDMVTASRPHTLVEIGVASGVSTVFLSTLLSDRLPESRLYACDKLRHVYDNEARPLGAFLFEVFGRVPANLTLEAGVASSAIRASQRRPERIDFVFLDANHGQPWPCLDLLSILDIVKPGSWVVLHDINLPLVSKENSGFGPLYLFRNWPGEKKALAGANSNIGAIRLFDDPLQSAAALMQPLELPWAWPVPPGEWRGALAALDNIDPSRADELRLHIAQQRVERRGGLRDSELALKGANPWTRFAPDLVSEPLILHANPAGQPPASLVIRGLDSRTCRGFVFPNIVRAPDAATPLRVTIALSCDGLFEEQSLEMVFADNAPQWATAFAPEHYEGKFDVAITIGLVDPHAKLHAAWVRFDAIHPV